MRRKLKIVLVPVLALGAAGLLYWLMLRPTAEDDVAIARHCLNLAAGGLRDLADSRDQRFLGKVAEETAGCRGGERALAARGVPWVDWSSYWGAGDHSSRSDRDESGSHVFDRNKRGIDGTLLDLEYQRMELLKFNLFDNLTFEHYAGDGGQTLDTWKEMRLATDDPRSKDLEVAADGSQLCRGPLIRFRTLTGICNDIRNPAMGSTGQLFARHVEFESTFPDLELNDLANSAAGPRTRWRRRSSPTIPRRARSLRAGRSG